MDATMRKTTHLLPIGRQMAEHRATVRWEQAGGPFAKRQYSRDHTWSFDGGVTVPADASGAAGPGAFTAASVAAVPAQFTDASAVDPEEAYVASIASCHLLSFLPHAALGGFEVLRY